MNVFAIDLRDGEISEIVVTDSGRRWQDLAENYNAAMTFREKLLLKPIHINETGGRFFLPIASPFLQILAR
jgi:hypothetical protein